MKSKEIIVDINTDGSCSIEGQNFTGAECEKFIKEIEQELGQRTSEKRKAEYAQRTIKNKQKERA